MTFPVLIHLGPLALHPHFVFEALAYFVGVRLYVRGRGSDLIPAQTRFMVLAAAALSAALGSKLLYWLEWPRDTVAHLHDVAFLLGGKSIVGGLLGGLLGVELAKKRLGETRSTGDRFVLPLTAGMMIGRIGCFLSGLQDHTVGVATTWSWGVDFGDGVLRHPTQLYEIAALALIFGATKLYEQRPSGARFRLFMTLYLSFRFACDFLKPDPRWIFGLSAIQAACVLGLLYYVHLAWSSSDG